MFKSNFFSSRHFLSSFFNNSRVGTTATNQFYGKGIYRGYNSNSVIVTDPSNPSDNYLLLEDSNQITL